MNVQVGCLLRWDAPWMSKRSLRGQLSKEADSGICQGKVFDRYCTVHFCCTSIANADRPGLHFTTIFLIRIYITWNYFLAKWVIKSFACKIFPPLCLRILLFIKNTNSDRAWLLHKKTILTLFAESRHFMVIRCVKPHACLPSFNMGLVRFFTLLILYWHANAE